MLVRGGWQQAIAKMGGTGGVNASKAIIVGSGAGGSIVAMVLAEAGWDVEIFEKGPNYYNNLAGNGPFPTLHSNDELKGIYRYFEQPDPIAFPRTFRKNASQVAANTYVGDVNDLSNQVGGTFPHSDTKCTRLWDIDFKGLSLLGPVPGADMADWPFEYSDIAPYYDEIQDLIGVQGDVGSIPAGVQKHQPQEKPYPMPPGAQMRSSMLLAAGAKRVGLHPFFFPMAANTVEYNGSPVCNNCGFCSGYGCPVSAKPVNLVALRRALQTGRTNLRPLTQVLQVNFTGRRATGVTYVDATGQHRRGHRRHRCAGLLGDLELASGAAFRVSRPLRPHRQTDHVSKLLRRVRRLPQSAGARLQRPRVHAGGVRLQRSRLPRGPSRRTIGRAALHPCRPVRARREPVSDRGGQLLPVDPGAAAGRRSFSAARSRS